MKSRVIIMPAQFQYLAFDKSTKKQKLTAADRSIANIITHKNIALARRLF